MADNQPEPSGSGRRLLPHPVSLDGTAGVEDATICPWRTDETPNRKRSSAGTVFEGSPKRRRTIQLRDENIINLLYDSGSDEGDDFEDGNDEDEDLDVINFMGLRQYTRQMRNRIVVTDPEDGWIQKNDANVENGHDKETYTRDPGPAFSSHDPAEYFYQVWDSEFMELVVRETNLYAWQIISQFSDPDLDAEIPKYLESWTEITVEELYRYFAVLILMSFCLRSNIREYWETGIMGMPEFREIMGRNRFQLISKFLHFTSNESLLTSGHLRKIEKVAPVVAHCNKKFKDLYTPAQHLSLDESLLLWKGRLSWKQCIRSKAARFGIKSFELCEAETGYLLQYRLYTGKSTDQYPDPIHGFQDHTAKIVLDLIDGYLDVGHVLVMDNWLNQLFMTRYLKSRCTDVLGTLNRRRNGIPPAVKDMMPNVPRGTTDHTEHRAHRNCFNVLNQDNTSLSTRSLPHGPKRRNTSNYVVLGALLKIDAFVSH
ncbi:unnamed protein product [Arctia plantaginis]|uniref:PiggyBac transposable element-derived protein domain-containing protein n=1 Tax=Arctia plantaginis TaxID=874455 RepID=A0A8S1ALA0_ARCPL|nr:unnamed protein product [Arctia plantaginis]